MDNEVVVVDKKLVTNYQTQWSNMNTDVKLFLSPSTSLSGQSRAVRHIVSSIYLNAERINELIQMLGPTLNHEQKITRVQGMNLLYQTLQGISQTTTRLNPSTTSILLQFILQRLVDPATITDCLQIIHILVASHTFSQPSTDITNIVRTLFCSELIVPCLPQSARKIVYNTLFLLLQHYKSFLIDMGSELIYGFIQAMDGEKDPRNLMLTFTLFTQLVLSIDDHLEYEHDLFEITSCYFPITFNENSQRPFAIKKVDLVNALRATSVASPQLWIPFLIEKMTASLVETKLEAMAMFEFGLTNREVREDGQLLWPFSDLLNHIEQLSKVLMDEILLTPDSLVVHQALKLLKLATQLIEIHQSDPMKGMAVDGEDQDEVDLKSNGNDSKNISIEKSLPRLPTQPSASLIKQWIDWICQTTCRHLTNDYDKKMMIMSITILQTVISTGLGPATLLLNLVLPILEEQCLFHDSLEEKSLAIQSLVKMVQSTLILRSNDQDHPIKAHIDSLYDLCQSLIQTNSIQSNPNESNSIEANPSTISIVNESIQGLALLAHLDQGTLLDETRVDKILNQMIKLLLDPKIKDDLQTNVLKSIAILVNVHPAKVLAKVVHPVIATTQLMIQMRVPEQESNETNGKNEVLPSFTDLISFLHIFAHPQSMVLENGLEHDLMHGIFEENPAILQVITNQFVLWISQYYQISLLMRNLLSSLARIAIQCETIYQILQSTILAKGWTGLTIGEDDPMCLWTPTLIKQVMDHSTPQDQVQLIQVIHQLLVKGQDTLLQVIQSNQISGGSSLSTPTPSLDLFPLERMMVEPIGEIESIGPRTTILLLMSISILTSVPFDDPSNEWHSAMDSLFSLLTLLLSLVDQLSLAIEKGSEPLSLVDCEKSLGGPNLAQYSLIFDQDLIFKGIASLINKLPEDQPQLTLIVIQLKQKLVERLQAAWRIHDPTSAKVGQWHSVLIQLRLLAWSTKALIQRDHQQGQNFWSCLQEIFCQSPSIYCSDIANLYNLLFSNIDYLSRQAVLYKQKYWTKNVNSLFHLFQVTWGQQEANKEPLGTTLNLEHSIDGQSDICPSIEFESNPSLDPRRRSAILLSIVNLLKSLPHLVLIEYVDKVMPMLIRGLEQNRGQITFEQDAISALLLLIEADHNITIPYLNIIIPTLIKMASQVKRVRMTVRIASLNGLRRLLEFPYPTIYPYRQTVIDGLLTSLDDPKRLVRKAAVSCRNHWCVMHKISPSKRETTMGQ